MEELYEKVQIDHAIFFPVLCQVLSEWDKINDKCAPLFHGPAIITNHTQTIIEQNKTEYNQILNGTVLVVYYMIQRKELSFLSRQIYGN